jgi:hypothetical protein
MLGTDGALTRTVSLDLNVYDSIPGVPALVSPPDGAVDVSLSPLMVWSGASQAASYSLEVAEDVGFSTVVYSATINDTSHQLATALDATTEYFWRVSTDNACGAGGTSGIFSFTTAEVPPILLVDDDDNSPDVQGTYAAALDVLVGVDGYDIWDTNNSDNEPDASTLNAYEIVIWFTGDEFGGFAGPGPAGENALASWLSGGGCLLISSQDYYWDRGLTSFMEQYLGVESATSDVGQTVVTGEGTIFGGLGSFNLVYPFSNYSDVIAPDPTAELPLSANVQAAVRPLFLLIRFQSNRRPSHTAPLSNT